MAAAAITFRKVLVPKARIEIKEPPASTVEVSSDEIVIGRDDARHRCKACAAEPDREGAELGDKVTFEALV